MLLTSGGGRIGSGQMMKKTKKLAIARAMLQQVGGDYSLRHRMPRRKKKKQWQSALQQQRMFRYSVCGSRT